MSLSVLDDPLPLGDLIDSESFAAVCRSFSELFGIGIRIFANDGRRIVDIRAGSGDHCGYLFTVPATRALCTQLVGHIKTCELQQTSAPQQVDCFSGLRYHIVPIIYEGTTLGRIIFGPYAPATLQAPPAGLAMHEPELDVAQLKSLQDLIPRASGGAVAKILDAVGNVVDVIIHATYKAALASRVHIASISGAFSDLEKTSRDLQAANARLQELDRLKSNFVATVSHELRTPLTSIIGYSEMLLEGMGGSLSAEQSGYVSTILEKGDSLLQLIGQVLDLSRIESGNVVITRRAVNPKDIVDMAISDVAPMAARKKIAMTHHIHPDVGQIYVDADKIRRVLVNLLGNAIKFTPELGSVELRLDIVDAKDDKSLAFDMFEPANNRCLRICVSDNGIGIPKDKLEDVFESFFQVDNSSTREFGGTGLGLSIVKNFVKAHGGDVVAHSEGDGQGSVFVVTLPLKHITSP